MRTPGRAALRRTWELLRLALAEPVARVLFVFAVLGVLACAWLIQPYVPPVVVVGVGGASLALMLALLGQQASRMAHVERHSAGMGAALRQEEERFRRVVEAMPSGLLIVDAEGRILFANRRLEVLFGYPPGALVGARVEALLPEDLREAHRADRAGYALDPTARPMGEGRYLRGLRRDGAEVRVEIALAPLPTGAQMRIMAMVQDAGPRLRHEQALADARARAEEASAAKSQFLANMRHEIRTPLNAVLGMTQLLEGTPLDARQRDYLRTIHAAGHSLLGLFDDILDLARLETGQLELGIVPFRLGELLDAVRDGNAATVRGKGLRLSVWVEPGLPGVFEGDARRIRQVLMNLVGNAVKFTDHGEIDLRVESVSQASGRRVVRFRVVDTGIGLTPEQAERLFAPFTQGDGSSTRRFGGSGLGLVLCKRLVDRMGGEIGLESRPGEGSVFWFSLPLVEAAAAPTDAHHEAAPALPAEISAEPQPARAAGVAPDRAELLALAAALRENDFQAIQLFARLRGALETQIGAEATQALAEAVERLDFERALALLRERAGL